MSRESGPLGAVETVVIYGEDGVTNARVAVVWQRRRGLLGYFRKVTGGMADAEDLLSGLLLRALTQPVDGAVEPADWAHQQARQAASQWARARERRDEALPRAGGDPERAADALPDPTADTVDLAIAGVYAGQVQAALARLGRSDRKLLLQWWGGMGQRRMAHLRRWRLRKLVFRLDLARSRLLAQLPSDVRDAVMAALERSQPALAARTRTLLAAARQRPAGGRRRGG